MREEHTGPGIPLLLSSLPFLWVVRAFLSIFQNAKQSAQKTGQCTTIWVKRLCSALVHHVSPISYSFTFLLNDAHGGSSHPKCSFDLFQGTHSLIDGSQLQILVIFAICLFGLGLVRTQYWIRIRIKTLTPYLPSLKGNHRSFFPDNRAQKKLHPGLSTTPENTACFHITSDLIFWPSCTEFFGFPFEKALFK